MILLLFYHIVLFFIDLLLLRVILRYPPTTWLRFLNLAGLELFAILLLGLAIVQTNLNSILWAFCGHGSFFLFVAAFLIRRQFVNGKRKFILPFALFLFALLYLGLATDVLIIEPTALIIRHHTIRTSKITKPMRIVFVADIQTDCIGWYERKTLELVKKQNGDLILFGGDYLQASSPEHERKLITEFNSLLKEIDLEAPNGIYAIAGNQEYYTWIGWTEAFNETKIKTVSRTTSIDVGEIRLTLLGMYSSFSARSFEDRKAENRFRIIVGHAPIFALGEQKADLLLAGHTHGGQVQIPGYGAIITMSEGLPNQWASGLTTLPNGSELIVANGTGLERGRAPRVRFFCRPDFWVIDLFPVPH